MPGYPDTRPIKSLPGSSLSVRVPEILKLKFQYDVFDVDLLGPRHTSSTLRTISEVLFLVVFIYIAFRGS